MMYCTDCGASWPEDDTPTCKCSIWSCEVCGLEDAYTGEEMVAHFASEHPLLFASADWGDAWLN